jgi:hypothetical protein
MNKDKKLVFGILALLVGIVAVSISYAAFTQNLNINGSANVQATSWSVHFANLTNGVRNGTAVERTAPTIKSGRTDIGDYAVDFYTPGDSITYKFDVVNDGDYDAKIAVVTKGTPSCSGTDTTSNTNVCNNLEYTLKYTSNNQDVAVNDTLKKNETKNMTLVLRYKSTIGQNELPTAEVTVSNLGITLQYAQDSLAGGNPVTSTYVYTASTNTFHIGSAIPTGETTYDNYASTGKSVFIRHTIENDVITESYVGFIKDGNAYYLKGGDGGTSYTQNKSTLDEAYGSANCTDNTTYYSCSASGLDADARGNGDVGARDAGWYCYVDADGDSLCSDK